MLFSSMNNCSSTFASKISVLSIFFYDSELYFFINSLAFLKFVKVRKFYEFLKFIKFAFSVYDLTQPNPLLILGNKKLHDNRHYKSHGYVDT